MNFLLPLELCVLFHVVASVENPCRRYPSRSEPDKNYLWCRGSAEPPHFHKLYGTPQPFGTILQHEQEWIVRGEEDSPPIEAVIQGAFQDLVNVTAIRLDFPIRVVRAGDFQDSPPLTTLEITVSELDPCAFVELGETLQRLHISAVNESLFLHADSFVGLTEVHDLTLAQISRIVSREEDSACRDFLCALSSLNELHFGRDPYNEQCDSLMIRVPTQVELHGYFESNSNNTNNVSDPCFISRHTCEDAENLCSYNRAVHRCRRQYSNTTTLIPTVTGAWHWIPWLLAALMLLLLFILLAIVIYWLKNDSKYAAVSTNSLTQPNQTSVA